MVIKKKNETFNLYTCEMSFGELKAFYELTQKNAGAIIDEMRANLEWYFKRLPPPGAEPDEGTKKGDETGEVEKPTPKVEEPGPGEVADDGLDEPDLDAGATDLGGDTLADELGSEEGPEELPSEEAEVPGETAEPEDELPSPYA